jgi:hypothetical protein
MNRQQEKIVYDVLALLERLAYLSGPRWRAIEAKAGWYPSAEIHTVGPEAKVPYPEDVHTPSESVSA